MEEFWFGIIYKNPKAEHVCADFGVVLTCNGESDMMICRKCGNAWITPCSHKEKPKEKNVRKRYNAR
jgi:hypothetical protein